MKVQHFAYHTRYTIEQIERIANRMPTRNYAAGAGIRAMLSVVVDGDQYDFYGSDRLCLVLLWINDHRDTDNDAARAVFAAHHKDQQ